ncbi:MAG: hypothetical protein HW383_805 [Candidatus Magasanikbacteria bacterium]|nr:hypothetical protein [Candidatus Magasanikbacteria bacterium]
MTKNKGPETGSNIEHWGDGKVRWMIRDDYANAYSHLLSHWQMAELNHKKEDEVWHIFDKYPLRNFEEWYSAKAAKQGKEIQFSVTDQAVNATLQKIKNYIAEINAAAEKKDRETVVKKLKELDAFVKSVKIK